MPEHPSIAGLPIDGPARAEAHAEALRGAAGQARAEAIARRREGDDAGYLIAVGTARGLEDLAAELAALATRLRGAEGAVCPVCGSTDLDAGARRGAGSSDAVQCNSCGRIFVPSGGRRNF